MVPDANPRTRLLLTFFAGRHISPVGNSVAPQISIGTVAKEDARVRVVRFKAPTGKPG